MLEMMTAQRVHLQVTLHCEHFGHRVGDRRAGRKDHPAAPVLFLDVLHLEEHVEGPLRRRLRQPGHPGHLGNIKQILEGLRLIDEQPVNAKFFKREGIILPMLRPERLDPALQALLRAFQFLDNPGAGRRPAGPVFVLQNALDQFGELSVEKFFPCFGGQGQSLET